MDEQIDHYAEALAILTHRDFPRGGWEVALIHAVLSLREPVTFSLAAEEDPVYTEYDAARRGVESFGQS